MDEFFKLLAASTLAATFTLIVTWLKATRDDLRSTADYFVGVLIITADLASSYWLRSGSDPASELEGIRLRGLQHRINLLRLTAFASFHDANRSGLEDDLVDFLDACTGGRHGEKGRPPDISRAMKAQAVAARIDAAMRTSVKEASSLRAYARRGGLGAVATVLLIVVALLVYGLFRFLTPPGTIGAE